MDSIYYLLCISLFFYCCACRFEDLGTIALCDKSKIKTDCVLITLKRLNTCDAIRL